MQVVDGGHPNWMSKQRSAVTMSQTLVVTTMRCKVTLKKHATVNCHQNSEVQVARHDVAMT